MYRRACWIPILATHVHGASGTPQTREGGYPKRADSPATMRWALKTMFVPPAMHQPETAATVGFDESCSLAHVVGEGPDDVLVGGAVPRPLGPGVVACLRRRRPIEPVAGAERRSFGVEQDHADRAVALGGVEGVAELVAQLRRDRVVLGGSAQRQPAHRSVVADADGLTHGRRAVRRWVGGSSGGGAELGASGR